MLTRRSLLQGGTSLTATALIGRAADAAVGDPIRELQRRIDLVSRRAFNQHGMRTAIVMGVVTPETGPNGRLLFGGGETLVNPFGSRLSLNARTPFEIGSISKVFTSGIYYMLHGPYEGTLGTWLGERMTMSRAVAEIELKNLAIYEPGLPQDNQGGAYPPGVMNSVKSLFNYMAKFEPPYRQGTCYAYSNTGWSLLSMAALRLDSMDTDAYVAHYNKRLKQFCSKFDAPNTEGFHPGMKPHLPIGYTRRLVPLPARSNYRPSEPTRYGSGGIVSNGADMMRYLLYSMGRLPGGVTDPALVYQQTETQRRTGCSTGGSPVTSYGWFHTPVQTGQGPSMVLNKNGGVAGFTSWMGFTQWQGTGAPSTHGLFVMQNGPRATPIGMNAMKLLLRA